MEMAESMTTPTKKSSSQVVPTSVAICFQYSARPAYLYPGPRGFSWFFFAKEIKSKPQSGDNESWKRCGEREKPLVTLASNLTFMYTTAVKRVKLLIRTVTDGNLGNTCLSAAIFLSGGRPGEIMLWTNHLHLGGKEWFVNRGQAKACVNDGRQESRNKKTTL